MKTKLSIKIRLLILTLIILIAGAGFVLLYYLFSRKVQEHTQLQKDLAQLETYILSIRTAEKQFLVNDLTNTYFYQTEESTNINLIDQLSDKSDRLFTKLFNYNFISYNTDFNGRLNNIYKILNQYKLFINDLKLNALQRGYKTYGIEGEFRHFEAYFGNLAQTETNYQKSKNYLQLCAFAKDYLLTRDPKYISELEKIIADTKYSFFMSSTTFSNLEKYHSFANRLLEKDKIIGTKYSEGLLGELNLQFYRLENELLDLKNLIYMDSTNSIKNTNLLLVLVFSIIISLITIYSIFLARNINSPIVSIRRYVKELMKGKLPTRLKLYNNEETIEIANDLNSFVGSLKEKTEYAREIGKGNLDAKYEPLSDDDVLGISLVELGTSLENAKNEDRKYKVEEEKRTWTNEGLTRFSEILRLNNDNIEKLSDEIIKNLVKYLKANQGGLFLLNDDDKENTKLDLIAAFAYDRKKYLKKHIKLGEGLVGACALEKETFVLTEVPEDYLYVRSGLGQANPRCILISPLKLEETVLGIVEVASFNEFQPHEVEFVEKIAESIASTLNSAKINARTAILLEQSKKQAIEMANQEEQMRQNTEELRASQEEIKKKETERDSLFQAINSSSLMVEYDMDGLIIDMNEKFLQLLEIEKEEVIGMHHSDFIVADKELASYKSFWKLLKEGKRKTKFEHVELKNKDKLLLKQSYAPILDMNEEPYKIICISVDITESKLQEETINKQAMEIDRYKLSIDSLSSAIDKTLIKCEFSKDGKILNANVNFMNHMRKQKDELIGKNYKLFLSPEEKEELEVIWKDLIENKPFRGILKRKNISTEEVTIMTTLEPVKNEMGKVVKVIMLAEDLTQKN